MLTERSVFGWGVSARRWWLLVLGTIAAVAPTEAMAGLYPADLTVSIAGPGSAQTGAALTYVLTVDNVAKKGKICRPTVEINRVFCFVGVVSIDAAGVDVDFALPMGFVATSVTAQGGFACTLGSPIHCSGGTVLAGAPVTITVAATAGNTAGTFTSTATVDPANTILERDETNNSSSQSVTLAAPLLPDLWASETASPSPFAAWQTVTFTVSVNNINSGTASNIAIDMFTNLPAGLSSWTIGGGFTCNASGGGTFGQRLQISCTGGNLAPFATAVLRIELKLTNSFTPSGTPFTLFGSLDPQNLIAESDESNNLFTFAAIVQ